MGVRRGSNRFWADAVILARMAHGSGACVAGMVPLLLYPGPCAKEPLDSNVRDRGAAGDAATNIAPAALNGPQAQGLGNGEGLGAP